jgi:hypothetical protein
MSDQSPGREEQGDDPLPPDEPRLPPIEPRAVLVLVLGMASRNLEKESRCDQPRSIHRQAWDLQRNVPAWQEHVEQLLLTGAAAVNLSREQEACTYVLNEAGGVFTELDPLISTNTRTERVKVLYETLREVVGWALKYVTDSATAPRPPKVRQSDGTDVAS